MESACKNHPDRESQVKCSHCQAVICPDCQLSILHRTYCSWTCLVKAIGVSIEKFALLAIDYLKNKNIFSRRNLIDLVLVAGVLMSIILGITNLRTIHRISQKIDGVKTTGQTTIDSLAKQIDTLTVFTPLSGGMILQNRLDIEGETEENRIVSLSSNGQLVEAKIATGRKFSFKNIIAKPGQNHFVVRSLSEDGTSIVIEEIDFIYGKPPMSYLVRDFMRGDMDEKKIALTFDGGYLDNAAYEILDILKQEQVKATVFLTGFFMKKYPELVKRIQSEGHVIGNHTWTHPHMTTFEKNRRHETLPNISKVSVQQELMRTAELYQHITGTPIAPIWRAPYGEQNQEIRQWAAEVGFRHVGWTVGRNWENGMDTMDWVADKNSSAYHSADEIADKILTFGNGTGFGANGAIILMHLGTTRNDDYPHQKLPLVIEQFKKRGYQFVSVNDMF